MRDPTLLSAIDRGPVKVRPFRKWEVSVMKRIKLFGVAAILVLAVTAGPAKSINGMRNGSAYLSVIRNAETSLYSYKDIPDRPFGQFGTIMAASVNDMKLLPSRRNAMPDIANAQSAPAACAALSFSGAHSHVPGFPSAPACDYALGQRHWTGTNDYTGDPPYSSSDTLSPLAATPSIHYEASRPLAAGGAIRTRAIQPHLTLPACAGPRWIVTVRSLLRRQTAFPLAAQRSLLDTPCTLLVTMGTRPPVVYRDWHAVRVQRATSLRGIARLAERSVAPVLLFDPEAWPMTPRAEQLHPVAAVCRAAALAHARGKALIATPAVDLVQADEPRRWSGKTRYHGFEQTGWIGAMARCADGIVIQSQVAETNTRLYRRFVLTEVRQARAANLHVWMFAGLSTNPGGRTVTPRQLLRVTMAVRSSVAGFWLNIPASGHFCPRCGIPHPRRAYRLLQTLADTGAPPTNSHDCSAGCDAAPGVSGSDQLERKNSSMVWLLGASGLAKLARAAGGDALIAGPLNQPTTWVMGESPFMPARATRLWNATNIARLRAMPKGANVVLDIENWPLTPRWQRLHPVEAYRKASQLARRRDLKIIATPATDLVRSVRPLYRGNMYLEFVKLQLARKIAPYAQIYEIQAQNAEANSVLYRKFVAEIAAQVRSVDPRATLLAGLTTNPSGKPESVAVLYRDIDLTRGIVSGYWLNIPQAGRGCPRCGVARPEIAVRLLRRYFANSRLSKQ